MRSWILCPQNIDLQQFVTRFNDGQTCQSSHEHDSGRKETRRQNGALEHCVVDKESRQSGSSTQRVD